MSALVTYSFHLTNTSTGNQTFTNTDLEGLTPVAAKIYVNWCNNGTARYTEAAMSIGATDGTNEWAMCSTDENGVGTSDNYRRGVTDKCILMLAPTTGAVVGEAEFVSFNANNIIVNWTTAYGTAKRVMIKWYAGTDVTADAGTFVVPAGVGGTVNVTTSLEADFVEFNHHGYLFNDSGAVDHVVCEGWAVNGASTQQNCVSQIEDDGIATSSPEFAIRNDYSANQNHSGFSEWYADVTAWTATHFTVTTRNSVSGGDECAFLAINGITAFAVSKTTATSTGNQAYTGYGFKPMAVHFNFTKRSALNVRSATDQAETFVIGGFDGSNEGYIGITVQDNVGTMNTNSWYSIAAVCKIPNGSETNLIDGTYVSKDADGFTLNYSVVSGTARYFNTIAYQGVAPTVSTHPSNQTVAVGANATFSVVADGTPALTYQWQEDSGGGFGNIAGATSSSYTKTNCQAGDSGNDYRCVITNDYGNVTSNTASLTVTGNHIDTSLYVNNQMKLRV